MLKLEIEKLTTTWKSILLEIFQEFNILEEKYEEERMKFDGFLEIFPPQNLVFNAFNRFNFQDLKVVILGQDPYHQPKQANGLCFSVDDGIKIPPSLKNIFKEINNDLNLDNEFKSGNLEYLADQGILMLNNSLTVLQSKPNSHLKYWKGFSPKVIEYICENKENVIFLLWGNNAKNAKKFISGKQFILEANHPSPLSANKGGWWGNKHFSKTNKILRDIGKTEIKWC